MCDEFAVDDVQLTIVLSLYGIAGIAGTAVGGRMAGRDARAGLIASGLLLAAAMLGAPFAGTGLLPAAGIVILWGIGFGALPVCISTWIFKTVPDAREAGQAALVCVFQIALASGAFFGGGLVDEMGMRAAASGGGTLALAGAAAFYLLTLAQQRG